MDMFGNITGTLLVNRLAFNNHFDVTSLIIKVLSHYNNIKDFPIIFCENYIWVLRNLTYND